MQVHDMFPDFPLNAITADLNLTRSIEVTTDNILEGRLDAFEVTLPENRFYFVLSISFYLS